jgi:hypothetical protein
MKRPRSTILLTLSCLLAAPLVAQTQIGGGTCNSATLTGTYALSLTGRQATSSGNFTNVLQGNGSANFDGLSKVTITLTTDTVKSVATPLTWSGTYTMQSNCFGIVTITSGGSAALNVVTYNQGAAFLVTGSDATYSYSGGGNTQPTGCSAATLAGVYTFTGTGYSLSNTSVNGSGAGTGLLQLDGTSNITVNAALSGSGNTTTTLTLTGSYSISSNCLGSATLTDSKSNSYVMSFSVDTATSLYSSQLFATLAQGGKFLISGSANAIYGQPAATPADRGSRGSRGSENGPTL